MKKFKLYWDIRDNNGVQKTEEIEGYDIADAFRRAGYGGGAIHALDYYEQITDVQSCSTK